MGIGLFAVFTVAAQNVKEGVISFALTQQKQVSVSTSLLTSNVGVWTAPPTCYKTALAKLSTVNVLQSIAKVLHNNPGYYSSKAQLVLVQGELSGFFNVGESLAKAIPSNDTGKFIPTPSFSSTTMDRLNVTLDSGRHDEANPINGSWPVGHHQPWGQIFVKDTSKSLCENVTYFFSISVQECYDCFYLNSFISDSRFKFTAPNSGGPPCCSPPTGLTGNGRDIYYMTLAFDNTVNNIYLNPRSDVWVGIIGLNPTPISSRGIDGIDPDFLDYSNTITTLEGAPSPYLLRFTLNGILSYTWNLKYINKSDLVPDFIGTANYSCNGYGFAALYCSMFAGSVVIAERATASSNCCLDIPWYDSWYGIGWNFNDTNIYSTPINIPTDLTDHVGFNEGYPQSEIWGD